MKATHWLGLFLWRGGILFMGCYALVETVRWALRFLEIPSLLGLSLALLLVGFILIMLSLVLENKAEGSA